VRTYPPILTAGIRPRDVIEACTIEIADLDVFTGLGLDRQVGRLRTNATSTLAELSSRLFNRWS